MGWQVAYDEAVIIGQGQRAVRQNVASVRHHFTHTILYERMHIDAERGVFLTLYIYPIGVSTTSLCQEPFTHFYCGTI